MEQHEGKKHFHFLLQKLLVSFSQCIYMLLTFHCSYSHSTDFNILHVIFKALHGLEIYWKCSPCNQSTACRLFPPQAKRR